VSVAFYFDVHVPKTIAEQLELRGVDVMRAQDDGRDEAPDEELLARATELGRVLYTQDEDFLAIAADLQARSVEFAGIVYVHQNRLSIGRRVHDLEIIGKCYEPGDMAGRVEHLPL
jgi:predicted nuclease of predicted toxin-antitoxin system